MDGEARSSRPGFGSGPPGPMSADTPASVARPALGAPGGFRGMRGPGGRNLTEGPITSTLIIFSLPMLGGNILQQLNVTANQFWVAHLLGATDITAIGNANSVMMLMMGAIFGATMAANILIAQQVGAGA